MTLIITVCATFIIVTCCFLVKIAFDFISYAKHEMMCIQRELITIRNQYLIYNEINETKDVSKNLDYELVSKDYLKLDDDVIEFVSRPLSVCLNEIKSIDGMDISERIWSKLYKNHNDNVFVIIAANALPLLNTLSLLLSEYVIGSDWDMFKSQMEAILKNKHESIVTTEYYRITDNRCLDNRKLLDDFHNLIMKYPIILEVKE